MTYETSINKRMGISDSLLSAVNDVINRPQDVVEEKGKDCKDDDDYDNDDKKGKMRKALSKKMNRGKDSINTDPKDDTKDSKINEDIEELDEMGGETIETAKQGSSQVKDDRSLHMKTYNRKADQTAGEKTLNMQGNSNIKDSQKKAKSENSPADGSGSNRIKQGNSDIKEPLKEHDFYNVIGEVVNPGLGKFLAEDAKRHKSKAEEHDAAAEEHSDFHLDHVMESERKGAPHWYREIHKILADQHSYASEYHEKARDLHASVINLFKNNKENDTHDSATAYHSAAMNAESMSKMAHEKSMHLKNFSSV